MKINITILILFLAVAVWGQTFEYNSTQLPPTQKAVTQSPLDVKYLWNPQIVNLEAAFPGGNSYRSFLLRQKQQLPNRAGKGYKSATLVEFGDADNPIVISGFEANPWDGSVPCDNDVAISDDSKLMTVVNSNIQFYDIDEDSLYQTISLEDFADTLGLSTNMYDPKLIYDPVLDRFIMVYLSGNTDVTSNIVVCFSTTNNPIDPWHIYSLSGNPLNDSVWSDYPMVAITDDELFITVNALINDTIHTSDSWKYLFKESYIWQIDKQDGFAGNSLDTKVWNDIRFNSKPIRNLCPIQGGSSSAGPNLFLLSNRNFDIENDSIFILEITGLQLDNNTTLEMVVRKADQAYGLAPDGLQPITNNTLQTNDSRVLGGYIENDLIHFVGNTVHPDSNRSAVYHGTVTDLDDSKTVTANIIGNISMDFGYPNISYSGLGGDDQAIISFNHTSQDTAAGVSIVFYQGGIGYSERISIKQGDNFINTLNGPNERWGDYSGTQRKYDEPGTVWIAGLYGTEGVGGQRPHNRAFVASVKSAVEGWPAAIASAELNKPIIKTYPNPTEDRFTVEFNVEQSQLTNISLYTIDGRVVKTFLNDRVKKGQNRFSFNLNPLASGIYLLKIEGVQGEFLSERIVVR